MSYEDYDHTVKGCGMQIIDSVSVLLSQIKYRRFIAQVTQIPRRAR
jgi:hypothetical protein